MTQRIRIYRNIHSFCLYYNTSLNITLYYITFNMSDLIYFTFNYLTTSRIKQPQCHYVHHMDFASLSLFLFLLYLSFFVWTCTLQLYTASTPYYTQAQQYWLISKSLNFIQKAARYFAELRLYYAMANIFRNTQREMAVLVHGYGAEVEKSERWCTLHAPHKDRK